jgi:hypothetical protein
MIDFFVFKVMANADPENVKAFYKIYGECVKELGLPLREFICHIWKLKQTYNEFSIT